jgi:hypothetical protein
VFQNQVAAGRHFLRIALRGVAGNPHAIGALVTLELADGSRQSAEIHAGSGYGTQSSAAVFFAWPDGSSPRAIHVRWPGGRTTTRAVPATVHSLVLSPE